MKNFILGICLFGCSTEKVKSVDAAKVEPNAEVQAELKVKPGIVSDAGPPTISDVKIVPRDLSEHKKKSKVKKIRGD